MSLAWLQSADGRRWLAGSIPHEGGSLPPVEKVISSVAEVVSQSGAILVLEEQFRDDFAASLDDLWTDLADGRSTFMVLVPRAEAPAVDPHYGRPIFSFLCSADVFRRFLALAADCWPETLLFAMLHLIANGELEVDRLLVRQLPTRAQALRADEVPPKTVIVPHRGQEMHLRSALRYLTRAAGELTIHVGLDVDEPEAYDALVREYPEVRFFRAAPAPVGPYVIRQHLAENSVEPFLSLQDSDDLSCYDRFAVLGAALAADGCGMVGSHELCLDDIRGVVHPVRFPLDASGALAMCPNHALLHGTLMSRRSAFFGCGGLSTHLPIASDTQFLLRAYFSMKIRNVDEFLYIRRRHPNSLTNAPETIYDNPLRRSLNAQWTADFEAIKRGDMRIEESSLRPMRRTDQYRLEPIVLPA